MNGSTVVLVAMLTSALTAVGTVYVVERYKILPEQEAAGGVVVPELKGLTEADARKNAQAVQVALLVAGREPSEKQDPGTVLRQSIPVGQRVPAQHPVSVVLAQEVLKVPDVMGLVVSEATLKLKDKGYELKVGESVPSSDVESGRVVEQDPAPGSELKKGAAVTVKASSGAEQVEVPQLAGMAHNQAKEKLEKLGLEVKFAWVALPETASYRVIRQTPRAGELLKPGESVQLVVNR
jgi:serine/threonine-protein kinase